MPNWCSTNWNIIAGRDDIIRFCNIVNSLWEKPDYKPNEFGKTWLVNLAHAMGLDVEALEKKGALLRGLLDPDPESVACMCLQNPEKSLLVPEKTGDPDKLMLAFSTQTAWAMPDWLAEALSNSCPGARIGWRASDDMGNFFEVHDAELMGEPIYEVGTWEEDTLYFYKGQDLRERKILSGNRRLQQ